jgi:hypothetical protein
MTLIYSAIVASLAFSLSLWNFWFTQFRKLTIQLIPHELVIRQFPPVTICFLYFTILVKGPSSKWATIKFTEASFGGPDSYIRDLIPSSHAEDDGLFLKLVSKNKFIPVKGGESESIIIAYQSSEVIIWQVGDYILNLNAEDEKGQKISIKPVHFILNELLVKNASTPNKDQLVKLLPYNVNLKTNRFKNLFGGKMTR